MLLGILITPSEPSQNRLLQILEFNFLRCALNAELTFEFSKFCFFSSPTLDVARYTNNTFRTLHCKLQNFKF